MGYGSTTELGRKAQLSDPMLLVTLIRGITTSPATARAVQRSPDLPPMLRSLGNIACSGLLPRECRHALREACSSAAKEIEHRNAEAKAWPEEVIWALGAVKRATSLPSKRSFRESSKG